jgi:hypothetical protein
MHQNFILFLHIIVFYSSASRPCFFHPFLFFFAVLTHTPATSASVSVCNSETIGDSLARDSKTSVLMMHVAFAESLDSLRKLQRGMH